MAIVKQPLIKRPRPSETIIQAILFSCAALSIFVTISIVVVLGNESLHFFSRRQWELSNKSLAEDLPSHQDYMRVSATGAKLEPGMLIRVEQELMFVTEIQAETIFLERGVEQSEIVDHSAGRIIEIAQQVTLKEFFTKTEWNPQIGAFGVWALINATGMTSTIAIIVALPLGLAIAIYLSEYASLNVRGVIKPILELLAGIPTVVYGYFALTFMTPLLRTIFGVEVVEIYNTASAGIVIGILILPLVSSMSEDALRAVPHSLREAALSLGATRFETALKVVVPAAISGIAAAFIIAISRAIGETMIVALAAGAGPNFTFNPFKAAETMTGHIVRISGGDLSYDSIDYNSIFAIGLVLFMITLVLNIISQRIVKRFREIYE